MRQEKHCKKDKIYSGEKNQMKYLKIIREIKKKNLKTVDIARVLGVSKKELKEKLNGKKPLYINEAEKLFGCLGIEKGEEKLKFF